MRTCASIHHTKRLLRRLQMPERFSLLSHGRRQRISPVLAAEVSCPSRATLRSAHIIDSSPFGPLRARIGSPDNTTHSFHQQRLMFNLIAKLIAKLTIGE